jgi:hypothetical protein
MLELIKDIQKALKAEAHISALSLALTIPDICGEIAFPEIKKVSERYKKWYDKYIPFPKDFTLKFDGLKCYKLRCALLHSGNTKGIPVHEFELCINRPGDRCALPGGTVFSTRWENNDESTKKELIRIDIYQLCVWLTDAASDYYERHEDKTLFDAHKLNILDMDAEREALGLNITNEKFDRCMQEAFKKIGELSNAK